MSAKPRILPTKLEQDPERRTHQARVKEALLEGQAWGLTYLLSRVKEREPYDNYHVPDDPAVFEFTVKGVLRLEMLSNPTYRGWRRMFGSNTRARDLATWRSRASVKAFENLGDTRAYIEADPLLTWDDRPFPWPQQLPADDWYVLFQILDVWLPGGQVRWSEMLATFLREESALLQLVAAHDVLPPAKGDTDG
jgi:hypothetical protein